MKIVIAGGSGLIGQVLATRLVEKWEVAVLTRRPSGVSIGRPVAWSPDSMGDWAGEVAEADVVINLAGAGIAEGRWSAKRKKELWDSRVDSTRAIVKALGMRGGSEQPLLVSASAIGYYGARGDEELDESRPPGSGFLADLSAAWEEEARRAGAIARVVIFRIGLVLALQGGALPAMLPVFRLGLGGPLGRGDQWMSWIHIEDLVGMIESAIRDPEWRGVFNAVGPEPVRNREFTRTLGRVLRRPTLISAPRFALRTILGEMADPLLLTGQRVLPAAARGRGFEFRYASLEPAFRDLLESR